MKLLEAKLALVLVCLARGLLDFIWSIRQLNYALALIGAAPEVHSEADRAALRERAEAASAMLGWPAPWRDPAQADMPQPAKGSAGWPCDLLADVPGHPGQGLAVGQHGIVQAGAGGRRLGDETLPLASPKLPSPPAEPSPPSLPMPPAL